MGGAVYCSGGEVRMTEEQRVAGQRWKGRGGASLIDMGIMMRGGADGAT